MNKNTKEVYVLFFGLFLIILVVVFFWFRFQKKNSDNNESLPTQTISLAYENITAKDLFQKKKEKESFKIIDTRSYENYSTSHILDSVQVLPEEIENSLESFKTQIVFINDQTSEEFLDTIAQAFIKRGAEKVYYLIGGVQDWTNASQETPITYGDPDSFSDRAKVSFVSQENFKKTLQESPDKIFILDVRTATEFSQGHIPGATNIPLVEIEKRRQEIPFGKLTIVYSKGEIEAFQAAVRLFDSRLLKAPVLTNGFVAWQDNGGEIEK